MAKSVQQTVHIVDDDDAARKSLVELCRTAGWHTIPYVSAESFLRSHAGERPACIVVDLRLEGMHGLELVNLLASRSRNLPVVVVTAFADVSTAVAAMRLGAINLIEKPYQGSELVEAIQEALQADEKQCHAEQHFTELQSSLESLTTRERKVLEYLLVGKQNKTIAKKLDVSQRTIEIDRARILQKFHVRNTTALAVKATELSTLSDRVYRIDTPGMRLRKSSSVFKPISTHQ